MSGESINTWQHEQLRATNALLKFCDERGRTQDPYIKDLRSCAQELEKNNIGDALRHFSNVPLGGNNCFNDWWPPTIYPNETAEYVFTVFEALVHQWSRLMRLSKSAAVCPACDGTFNTTPVCLTCYATRLSQ